MKIKPKKGIEWSYRPWERKTLQKFWWKTTKKLCATLPSRREREKSLKKLLKKMFELVKELFLKKPETRCSIDRKTGSINRTRQRFTEFLKQDFDWSKIRLDQSKFWKNCFLEKKKKKKLIFLKAYLKALNIRYKNAWVWDEMLSQNTSFKPNFPKILILNNLPFFF